MWHALETRLAEARQTELGHLEFLSLLIQDELTNRENNMLATRIRNAGFGLEKTFTEFDFRFNESALSAEPSSAAIGRALIEHGYRVLFACTTGLAQRCGPHAASWHSRCRR